MLRSLWILATTLANPQQTPEFHPAPADNASAPPPPSSPLAPTLAGHQSHDASLAPPASSGTLHALNHTPSPPSPTAPPQTHQCAWIAAHAHRSPLPPSPAPSMGSIRAAASPPIPPPPDPPATPFQTPLPSGCGTSSPCTKTTPAATNHSVDSTVSRAAPLLTARPTPLHAASLHRIRQ